MDLSGWFVHRNNINEMPLQLKRAVDKWNVH